MSKYLLFDLLKLQILAENRSRHFTAFSASNIPSVMLSASSNTFYCLNTQTFFPQNKQRKSAGSVWAYECPNAYCYRGTLTWYSPWDPFLPISRIHFTWLPGKIKKESLEKWNAAHVCFKLIWLTYVLRLWKKSPYLNIVSLGLLTRIPQRQET